MNPKTVWLAVRLVTLAAALSPALLHAETAYFIIANPDLMLVGLSDSYVLPLTDPDDIEFARVAAHGGAGGIVIAKVTKGANGLNRDRLAPGMPQWSWHVTEFMAFATSAIEICDGTPAFTEIDAQNAGEGEEWIICYWNYTVVAEVTDVVPVEESRWGRIKALFGD